LHKHNEASQLTATLQLHFYKLAGKINHGACVGRCSQNKSSIGKFCNA